MANESINLNLIPKGEMPVIHVSQFDNGRQFTINLLKGSDEYTLPTGYTATLNCRKADRTIVTLATTSVLSNALTFTTTTQLCACAGKNLCEVVIKDAEDYQVGTLNFILEVERDPLQGGIESTSEIHDLENQIEDITTEIISENYYTKTETDTLLDAKADASDLATVATSGSYTDLNNLPKLNGMTITGNRNAQWYGLASKLSDLSDVTLSPELSEFEILIYNSYLNKWINSKMSYTWLIDKPSIPDAQVQSDYAQVDATKVDYIKNKPDISGMIEQAIFNIMPIASVSSAPVASFNTELAAPLQEIKCTIIPAQSGEGTPSPSNPRPISGYTEANITRCGKNQFPQSTVALGGSNPRTLTVYFDRPLLIDTYTLSYIKGGTGTNYGVNLYDGNGHSIGFGSGNPVTRTVTFRAIYAYFYMDTTDYNNGKTVELSDIMLQFGSTASDYAPYNGNTYPIAFDQTVYGGVLDVTSGKLKPCIEYPSYNGETLSGRWLSSEATYIEGATPPIGSQVVSLDDYGAIIDITPVQISAIVGVNNVYSDCGNTAVKYKDTIQHYIDTRT